MDFTPRFFKRLARVVVRERPELARRYLHLRRRHKILRAAVRQAHRQAIYNSLLADVGFRPPLSVAGCDSQIVAKAEGLALLGIPVAFDRDGRGRHRGTSAGQILRRLRTRLEKPVSFEALLGLYRAYMAACPAMLPSHSNRKWSKLPRLLERNRLQLETAENTLLAMCAARCRTPSLVTAVTASCTLGTSRFMAFVDRDSLARALIDLDIGSQAVVGFRASTGLHVNKQWVATLWGRGEGSAVLRAGDLRSLIHGDNAIEGPVGIECLPETWRGWAGVHDLNSPAKTFEYHSE